MPTKDNVTLSLEDTFPFPPAFDFHGVSVRLIELDGMAQNQYVRFHQLSPGKHTVKLKVQKGPTGAFGRAPILGTCYGSMEIDVQANKVYEIKLERADNEQSLILIDPSEGKPLAKTPCL